MESGINRLKVVWICHFTNNEIQNILPISQRTPEFASWVPNLIKGFENRKDIELHVISPHNFLNKNSSVELRGVQYHFFTYGIPILHKSWPDYLDVSALFNYRSNRKIISKIVNKINPDIIDLHGAENAYYSSSVMNLYKDFPIKISIQGFIHMDSQSIANFHNKKRVYYEKKILSNFKYFGGEPDSYEVIKKVNANCIFNRFYYPINLKAIKELRDQRKEYDICFYGRLTKEKGFEDFLKTIQKLAGKYPKIKACIAGIGSQNYIHSMISKYNCTNQVHFLGFLENQRDLFLNISKCKIALVPTYNDRLPSTIRELLYMRVPVIAYSTGGIPYLNMRYEVIKLVRPGDIESLYKNSIQLLEDHSLRNKLAVKGREYASSEFGLETNVQRIIRSYKEILNQDEL